MPAQNPRWSLDNALGRARVAHRLALKHRAVIEPRLDSGEIDQLAAHRAALGDSSDVGPLTTQKTATASEREIAADAYDLIVLARTAVRRSRNGNAALRSALGVGGDLKQSDTAGILLVLGAIATHSASLRACRMSTGDIEEAAALATALRSADASQTVTQDARADSTEQRNDIQLELEAEVEAIHVAGTLGFRKDAAIRARFARLVSSNGPEQDDDPGPQPVTPAPPA